MSKRFTRHPDGTVHWSLLKHLAKSPAHYEAACRAACLEEREPTRVMRVGTGAHLLVLGQRDGHRVVQFPGDKRVGKAWAEFAEEHAGAEILTAPEWSEATAIADAVRKDPVAAPLLLGRHEVPLQWNDAGIHCSTDGVDVIGDGWLAELKTTHTAQPSRWIRHALTMHYPAQLVFYNEGAKANGIDVSRGLFVIGVEVVPPFAVTVLRLTAASEEYGRRCVSQWLELLRRSEENDFWPAYTQHVVDLDLPPYMVEVDDDTEAA